MFKGKTLHDNANGRCGSRFRPLAVKSVGIAALAVTGSLLLAPAATAATPEPPEAQVGGAIYTEYDVNNLSPFQLDLKSAESSAGWAGSGEAPSGSTAPGSISTWYPAPRAIEEFDVEYEFTDAQGHAETVAVTKGPSPLSTACAVTGESSDLWTCDVEHSGYGRYSIYLRPSTSTVDLSEAARNQFASALNNLCQAEKSANGAVTCEFKPDESWKPTYVEAASGFVPTGAATYPGCHPNGQGLDSYTYTGGGSTSETLSNQDSVSVTVQVGVPSLVNSSLSANTTWGKSFSIGQSYTDGFKVQAKYGYLATPFWYPTIATAKGNFTATVGDVTYQLNDVTIQDSGVGGTNPDGSSIGDETATTHQVKMTQAQWDQNCPGLAFPGKA